MRSALWPTRSVAYHCDELNEMLARELEAAPMFVARLRDGSLGGFAESSIRRDYVNGCSSSPVLFLEGVYVVPEFRRHGIGKNLIDAVRTEGKALGCTEFASDASIENVPSHSFHRALGFEETERVVFFRATL